MNKKIEELEQLLSDIKEGKQTFELNMEELYRLILVNKITPQEFDELYEKAKGKL